MAKPPEIRARLRGHGTLLGTDAQPFRLPKEETRRKRFYKSVVVATEASETSELGQAELYRIHLDGRAVSTPGRAKLVTHVRPLAEAIASEWETQTEYIDPATMPLTKLLNTCIDRIAPNPEQIVDGLLQYADTDLLCYRAERPSTLVARQTAIWQPVLDWVSATHDISLPVVTGITPLPHSPDVKLRLRNLLLSFPAPFVTGIQGVASLSSSLSLALALVGGRLSGAEVAAAANLDETWQMERWGEDKEARDRLDRLQADVASVEWFLKLHNSTA